MQNINARKDVRRNRRTLCRHKVFKETLMKKLVLAAIAVIAAAGLAMQPALAAPAVPDGVKASYMVNYETGTVIHAQNEDRRLPIASMCKIMSLVLVYESIEKGALDPEGEISVSREAAGMGGSQVFLDADRNYKVSELIKSVIICSANDATYALAEAVSGSEEAFVQDMNQKAQSLGMNDTLFSNSTGLPRPSQYSTAKDVATMTAELLKYPNYFSASSIWMDKFVHNADRFTEMTNTNKLVRFYRGCDGGKTGYTAEAGHCISATAQRDNMRMIAVIIGAPDSKTRFAAASGLLNHGFANYRSVMLVDKDKPLDVQAAIKGGKADTVSVYPQRSYHVFAERSSPPARQVEFELSGQLRAPVKKGDSAGRLLILENGAVVEEIPLIAGDDVAARSFFDSFGNAADNWNVGGK